MFVFAFVAVLAALSMTNYVYGPSGVIKMGAMMMVPAVMLGVVFGILHNVSLLLAQ